MYNPTINTSVESKTAYLYPPEFVRAKVNAFTEKADEFANQFFAPEKSSSHTVVHHHHYHSYSPFYSPWSHYSSWYYTTPVMVIPDRGHRRNDDEGGKVFLTIAAIAGFLIASYTIGVAISSLNEASKELDATKEFENDLSFYQRQAAPQDQLYLGEAQRAASLKERICARITNSASWDLALRVSVAVGLILTAVGAALLPVAAPVLAVGVTLTVISLAAMLFKWGFESYDKANIRDAQELKALVADLKRL